MAARVSRRRVEKQIQVIGHERQIDYRGGAAPTVLAAPAIQPPDSDQHGRAEAIVSLRLEGLRKSFGACRAVDGVTLDVREGELLAILGPSGCGKSTLLRLVAGLERQEAGRIVLHGRDVGSLAPAARGCGV